jgi:hypothetical protein
MVAAGADACPDVLHGGGAGIIAGALARHPGWMVTEPV